MISTESYTESCRLGTSHAFVYLLGVIYAHGAVSIRKTVLPGVAIPMLKIRRPNGRLIFNIHSVESSSVVDPQWNIWYWGSKWNLHTVCWSAVGCEWGTTSVYFGLLMFALSLVDFLSLLLRTSTYFSIFHLCRKYHLNYTYKIFKKFHVGLEFEWGL